MAGGRMAMEACAGKVREMEQKWREINPLCAVAGLLDSLLFRPPVDLCSPWVPIRLSKVGGAGDRAPGWVMRFFPWG